MTFKPVQREEAVVAAQHEDYSKIIESTLDWVHTLENFEVAENGDFLEDTKEAEKS